MLRPQDFPALMDLPCLQVAYVWVLHFRPACWSSITWRGCLGGRKRGYCCTLSMNADLLAEKKRRSLPSDKVSKARRAYIRTTAKIFVNPSSRVVWSWKRDDWERRRMLVRMVMDWVEKMGDWWGKKKKGGLEARDLFTFVRDAMTRAYVVNRATTNWEGVLSFLTCALDVLGSYWYAESRSHKQGKSQRSHGISRSIPPFLPRSNLWMHPFWPWCNPQQGF